MQQKFGEGKYDNTVAKVRSMTNAKHAMTIVLDGDRGNGFALHIGGVTQTQRITNTQQMLIAIAQVAQALMGWVKIVSKGMTETEVAQAEQAAEGFELTRSPERCAHCGATLPQPSTPTAQA